MTSSEPYMLKSEIQARVEQAGWNINWDSWETFSPYEKSFFEAEFTGLRTFDYYQNRLKALGFKDMGSVLDVACGMGQWSIGLAALNDNVKGIDMNADRILFARVLAASMNKPNTQFSIASMETMDFPDAYFDGLFCYGSFMFARMDVTLREFNRLLKKGGRAYLNANTTGWYAHLFLDRGLRKRNPSMIKSTISMAMRMITGKTSNIIVRKSWLERLFDETGFKIVASGAEGCINLGGVNNLPPSAYPPTYYGLPSLLEYVIEKR